MPQTGSFSLEGEAVVRAGSMGFWWSIFPVHKVYIDSSLAVTGETPVTTPALLSWQIVLGGNLLLLDTQ
jgi:hypothetical protein